MHVDMDGGYSGGNKNIEGSITENMTLQGLEVLVALRWLRYSCYAVFVVIRVRFF
jgi:hypothetical protein